MLQNATDIFIIQTASRKFLENLEEVINSEATSPVVRERLLDVLASAAYAHGKKPGKEGFSSTWRKVRPTWMPAEGVPFDQEDGLFESAFPRRTGGDSVGPGVMQGAGVGVSTMGMQQLAPQAPPVAGVNMKEDQSRRYQDGEKYLAHLAQQSSYEAARQDLPPPPYSASPTPVVPFRRKLNRGIIPPEEDIRRLMQECDVARNNAQVFSQALTFATPSTLGTDPVIQEFHNKCRTSQELIVAEIPWASAGAERSRLAAANAKKNAMDSGSDSAHGKLSKSRQNGSAAPPTPPTDLTKEEKLLAALLTANQELVDVFRIYEELEKLAFAEMEEKEIAKRSRVETKLNRTQIHYIGPDGSLLMEPASTGASSSRSGSPTIPSASSRKTSATSLPSGAVSPAPPTGGKRTGRALPLPPADHLSAPNSDVSSIPPSPMGYPQQQQRSSQPQPSPPPPLLQHPPQATSQVPPSQPHHADHSFHASLGGHPTLNLPPAASNGPRQPAWKTQPRSRQQDIEEDRSQRDRDGNEYLTHPAQQGAHEAMEQQRQPYQKHAPITLESLMEIQSPVDLTGQVEIPNLRSAAQGGLSDVYIGLMGERKVAVKQLRIRKSKKQEAYWEDANERVN
ncbi:hypothetical protein M408DRAFT_122012 [Serendipita vermifera MAFF 305830]|uniref:VHS domain-containing protein n=1 Tax=Serendipita vermifera MAFF 305830 TaxID=933852 RepID=A0A0C3BCX3_SERVB|nr:hypothetical protein M408DRAFT_122012 [Serendipita vermifera MAFF 305830]